MNSEPSLPAVSLVVPCRNERQHIETCVRSLLAQEVPAGGYEILVVDGMSDDGTRDILTRLAQDTPQLRVIDNLARITPCALNLGIQAARGCYIAIIGAHARYAPDYIRQSVAVLEVTGADNVGGVMMCEAEGGWQEAIAAAHHSPFAVGGARWHNPQYEGPADTVYGGVYRREVFERIGLFDETLMRNQDDELNLRLLRAGGTIWQSPCIKSWYSPRRSLWALFQQYRQYGYWKVRVIQKHKLPASIRHVVPGGFVFALLMLPWLGLWWAPAWWGWLGLIGVYSTGNVIASALTAAHRGWHLLPLLPPVFVCYHIGYGMGFLRGVWDVGIWRRRPAASYERLTRPISKQSSS